MKRGVKVGIAAAVAAVLVGGAALWWMTPRSPTADGAARAYLDALSAGDFAQIDAMRATRLDRDAEIILADAFAGAAWISDARVEEVDTGDGGARVRASASLGGQRRDVSFTLTASEGVWLLDDHLGSLEVQALSRSGNAAGDSVWIGGALAPAATRVALLPAEYPVHAAPLGLLTGRADVAVGAGEAARASIEVALSPEAAAAAQDQLDDYAQSCTAPAASVPDDCGLRVPWAADLASLQSIAFRIEQLPALTLSADGRGYAATGGVVIATATGTTRDGGPAAFTYRTDDWTLRGAVVFQGNEMVLTAG